jgi:hypothetical protein
MFTGPRQQLSTIVTRTRVHATDAGGTGRGGKQHSLIG